MDDAPRIRRLYVLVFAGGASSLGAEIAAARLMAPYFGASTIIWANTIAVCLVALSAGYWYGGRMADRRPDEGALRRAVLAAAVALALVPLAAGPFLDGVIRAFDAVDAGAFIGSLFAVLLLVSVPLVLLGMITPWVLKLALGATGPERTGEVAGRLYAVSTIGSLAGVFLSALLLIPLVGTQRTFIGAGLALAIVAASSGVSRRMVAVPAVLLLALALPPGVTKPADGEDVILAERETPYQYLRVIDEGDRRVLELNEGQAIHSIWRRDGDVLVGGYWDAMVAAPLAVLGRPPETMAMLGDAAGTIPRAYAELFPSTRIDGVEIDGEVTAIGREYFELGEGGNLTTSTDDARPFLRKADRRFDVIAVDAYRQPYIPFYLATKEFFALAEKRLTPGGAVMINVGHPEGQDDLERTLTRTLRTSFEHVARWPVNDTSTVLLASDVEPTAERAAAADVPQALAPVVEDLVDELEPGLDGGTVWTDDRAPVEWLVDASIVSFAAEG